MEGRILLGHTFIVVVSAIWVVTSYISGALVGPDSHGSSVIHPFLLTWLATSLFTLYLPVMHCSRLIQGNSTSRKAVAESQEVPMNAAIWSTPLWFLAQLSFNMSLARTSVTSNTIISSTSSLFTYCLSMLFLSEEFSTLKLGAIFATIAGTALITLSDSEIEDAGAAANSSAIGDVLVVFSAAFYGAYTVLMRVKMSGDDAERHVPYFFGYIGLFSTISLAPVVVLLLSTGRMSLSNVSKSTWLVSRVEFSITLHYNRLGLLHPILRPSSCDLYSAGERGGSRSLAILLPS